MQFYHSELQYFVTQPLILLILRAVNLHVLILQSRTLFKMLDFRRSSQKYLLRWVMKAVFSLVFSNLNLPNTFSQVESREVALQGIINQKILDCSLHLTQMVVGVTR